MTRIPFLFRTDGWVWATMPMLVSLVTACQSGDSLDPTSRQPPYIAIVAKAETDILAETGIQYSYRIKGISTGSTYDTVVTVSPADTVIVSVSPGTYDVSLTNLPVKCVSRYGVDQEINVPPGTNTAIARYYISCNVPLAVRVYTAGLPTDPEFIWQLESKSGGYRETGIIHNRDETLIFNTIPAGDYTVSLWNAPESCVFTNDGGRHQDAAVPATGNVTLTFSVICSKVANRPELLEFSWTYHDSSVVFIAKARDPDYNVADYVFDLTDCDGHSVLAGGARQRGGLDRGRLSLQAEPTMIGAFELGLSDQELGGRCASLRVEDLDGNTTPTVERLPTFSPGSAPEALSFNATLVGQDRLTTKLTVRDTDGDFFGTFVAASLRDGTLSPSDGQPDLGIYNAEGYEGTAIPDLPLGNRIAYSDVYAIIVYLVDLHGHFRKYVDNDTFK